MNRRIFRAIVSVVCAVVLSVSASAAEMLIPVGELIGIELSDGKVLVTAFDEAMGAETRAAGLQIGDRLITVDGYPISSTQDVRYALERSNGTVELAVQRGEKKTTVTAQPKITQDGPKLGIYLRQGISGVGTVTWYDPDDRQFGALGHGVNTPAGELLDMRRGSVYDASVAGVQKGAPGEPGQLVGAVEGRIPAGTLRKNTKQGIFGSTEKPWDGQALPVGSAAEVHIGEAVIRSTVNSGGVQEYSVEILKIYPGAEESGRNMLLQVTDPALLEATGGIVQGMSGSPIIQDGKLVGAVTHVLVNDPTTGYGIFIENMLDAAA